MTDEEFTIVLTVRSWVERTVIRLGLCPFAGKVFREGTIHYQVTAAATEEALLEALAAELGRVEETTLLIHPHVLTEFDAYNAFLDRADALLEALNLTGAYQIASFHPDYRFDQVAPDDPANRTNRSPFPMLHILREDRLGEAIDSYPDVHLIPERNIALMRKLGGAS